MPPRCWSLTVPRPQPYEHLMIIFFDILLLDDDICLRKPHRERRLLLKDTVQMIPGRSDLAHQEVLEFSRFDCYSKLERIFAKGVAERWEGFVLKGCEDPYFTIVSGTGEGSVGRWIKLKKDYIPGLGDTIDLCLVGAMYSSRDAAALGLVNKVSWTHFFVGCLTNQEANFQSGVKPQFRVVDVINHHCMSERTMQTLNQEGKYAARKPGLAQGFGFEYGRTNLPGMDVVFKTPFVVEMLGSGFEKPSGARFYTLRFPRIQKVHSDRSFEDSASFSKLQILAKEAVSVPHEHLMEEEREWSERVKSSTSKPQYITQRSQSLPSTTCSSSIHEPSMASAAYTSSSPAHAGKTGHGLGENSLARFRSSKKASQATTGVVPIYIDQPQEPGSIANPSGPREKFLASNENLSSCVTSQKRKAPHSTPEEHHKKPHIEPRQTPPNTDKSSIKAPLKIPRSSLSSATRSRSVCEQATTGACPGLGRSPGNLLKHAKSPLATIPLCIQNTQSLSEDTTKAMKKPNTTEDLDKFLHMLGCNSRTLNSRASTLETSPPNPALGIFFADIEETLLGTTLIELTNRILKILQSLATSPRCRSTGRIFVLDARFLGLFASKLGDTTFCLRETWDNIGREFFYACVAWDSNPESNLPVDEISGTPMDSGSFRVADDHDKWGRRPILPKVSVEFDRKQLSCLGTPVFDTQPL